MPHFETVLITGASSGLGHAIALELAKRGTRKFALLARRVEPMQALAERLGEFGATAEVVGVDVTDYERLQACIRELDTALGGFDLVLANSGVGGTGLSHEMDFETLKRTIDVNVLGAVATLHAAADGMVARDRGTLAGMSSLASRRGFAGSGTYSASKAALSTWLDTLRGDLHDTNVKVTDIRPGFVRTPMTDQNDFKMPFLLELEPAARRCVDDLERGKAVCTFPAPLSGLLWCFHRLPDWMWRLLAPLLRR